MDPEKTPDSPLTPDNRRRFMKRSLAAGIVASQPTLLTGLIRAQGGGGSGDTTTTEHTTGSTGETTETTGGSTTTDTTGQTTEPEAGKIYSSTVYKKVDGSWTDNANQAHLFGSPYGTGTPVYQLSQIPDTDTWGAATMSIAALWPEQLSAQWVPDKDARPDSAVGDYVDRDASVVVTTGVDELQVDGQTKYRFWAKITLVYEY